MFSLVLFWKRSCVVCKNGLFVKRLRVLENQKRFVVVINFLLGFLQVFGGKVAVN
jgi:hypothetical protein